MSPSRSDASKGPVYLQLVIILAFFFILSFSFIHDAQAGGPSEQGPIVSPGGIEAPGAMRADRIGRHRRAQRVPSLTTPRDPDNFLTRPMTSWKTLQGEAPSIRFPGRASLARTCKKSLRADRYLMKPLVPLEGGSGPSVITRRGSWTRTESLRQEVPLGMTLVGGVGYRSGAEETGSRFSMDLVLPARTRGGSLLFFESRAEYRDPLLRPANDSNRRFDLGIGGGWRNVWSDRVMFGVNGFLDTTRLDGEWYSSPGFGMEFAVATSRSIWDLTFNMYRGGGIDLKGGVTVPIMEESLDMRLYAEKYRFFDGEFILGSKAGVQISSPGRLVALTYEYGQDSRNPGYYAVGCSLTVPFCLEKIFSGKNPIDLPTAKSRAALQATRLRSDGVKRAWTSPDTVAEVRRTPQGRRWTTPGRLTDTIFSTKKTSDSASVTPKAQSRDVCERRKDCCERGKEQKKEEKRDEKGSLGGSLIGALLAGSAVSNTIFVTSCFTGATYLTGDYLYRNAFGPFELEPYELEEIGREMPKKGRRK